MWDTLKTPIMALNEIAIKKGLSLPFYDIIFSCEGTHNNSFKHKVIVGDVEATGEGSSKQISKQEAARNALMILEEKGIYIPVDMPVEGYQVATSTLASNEIVEPPSTVIGLLNELCKQKGQNTPSFKLISDLGPSHHKKFTFECKLDSFTTVATGSTKKKARQLAAQKMMEKVKDILPDLSMRCPGSELETLSDITKEDTIAKKYCEMFGRIDKSIKVIDYPNTIRNLMKARNLCINNFEQELQERTKESLTRILDKLELEYKTSEVPMKQKNLIGILVSLTTSTPFTTIGTGDNQESALKEAVSQVFKILDVFMMD